MPLGGLEYYDPGDALRPRFHLEVTMRVRVFVDFWNFNLSLRRVTPGFMTDWTPIGPILAREAARRVDP